VRALSDEDEEVRKIYDMSYSDYMAFLDIVKSEEFKHLIGGRHGDCKLTDEEEKRYAYLVEEINKLYPDWSCCR
jgi:hypothetical protein